MRSISDASSKQCESWVPEAVNWASSAETQNEPLTTSVVINGKRGAFASPVETCKAQWHMWPAPGGWQQHLKRGANDRSEP